MKVCGKCGEECSGGDGDNICTRCKRKPIASAERKARKKAMDDAMRSCGLVKVRGACGGIYWE